jgi:hypothetical protein
MEGSMTVTETRCGWSVVAAGVIIKTFNSNAEHGGGSIGTRAKPSRVPRPCLSGYGARRARMDRAPDPPQGWDFLTNAGIASGRMGRSVAVQLWVPSELGHPRQGFFHTACAMQPFREKWVYERGGGRRGPKSFWRCDRRWGCFGRTDPCLPWERGDLIRKL